MGYASKEMVVSIMDLMRPQTPEQARQMVETYAWNEPEVLKTDFFNSLCAASTPDEIQIHLSRLKLDHLMVTLVSYRHFTIHGFMRYISVVRYAIDTT
jgi:hypothetical protein